MLDPIEFAKQLEKSGLPRQAAELIAKGYSHLPSNLATKEDISGIKEDISKLEGRVDRLDARLDRLEGKIEKNTQDIATLKEQILNLKNLVWIVLAIVFLTNPIAVSIWNLLGLKLP